MGHYSYNCPGSMPAPTVNLVRLSSNTMQEVLCSVDASEFKDYQPAPQFCRLDGAYFEAVLSGDNILAYADSGAGKSFTSSLLVKPGQLMPLEEPINFTLMDKTPLIVMGRVLSELEVAGETKQVELFIADIPWQVFVGRDVLGIFSLVFDIGDSSYWLENRNPQVKFPLVRIEKKETEVLQFKNKVHHKLHVEGLRM
ncbi:hypothetical protein HOLleu_12496 [Holothuria leucospilota]|uniref:Uncharacterized protein n=1 Tax=Holothuria leucospilota TaxID=206669 RepID=A0A9Q1HD02_HOLLE|nr:hypothetical protein HOLleu_12496 [Holothuria leucospilota]